MRISPEASIVCDVQVIGDFSTPAWDHMDTRSIITIGAYDGLHVGHRLVIDRVVAEASAAGCQSVLVTFDRHPASLVRPESAPKLLTDHAQKMELLQQTGLDAVGVVTFDQQQAAESPEDFVRRVLVECFKVETIVVGEDFHFGRARAGNVALLRELGHRYGFKVEPLHLLTVADGSVASSTFIRELITRGDIENANRNLGHIFEIRGTVAHGDQRGRTIGFPTANVEVPVTMCVPADGVYAAWYVRLVAGKEETYPCAINIGRRPTFYDDAPVSLIEAHIIGETDLDLYNEVAMLRFVSRLRGEQKFAGLEEMKAQLAIDIANASAILSRA
ncbi:MAG: bifunctional riboflavin kinase/FAD synthetase [Actinomycetes bacterium]